MKSKPLDPRNRRVSVIVQHAWKESDLPEKLRAERAGSAKAGMIRMARRGTDQRTAQGGIGPKTGGDAAGESLTFRGHGLRRGSERRVS